MSDNFREVYGWATTPDEAKAAAKTAAKRIERSKRQVEITMTGTVAVVAGMKLTLADFRPGISGDYKVVSVRHSLSRSAWLTHATCEGA